MSREYLNARLDELKEKLIDLVDDFADRFRREIEDCIEALKALPIDEPLATQRQIEYLRDLYKKLKKPIPPDLDLLSRSQASKEIDKLLKELREGGK